MVKSLTERIYTTLARHGPASIDTIAQRISVKAKLISPRLSALKAQRRVTSKRGEGGEDVFAAVKAKA